MSYLEENAQTGRIILPDLIRAFALFGIVLVNVAYFAYPAEGTYYAGGLNEASDHGAFFIVKSLFYAKSYTLFSFMFGVGLAYQMLSAERQGVKFGPRYFRRMIGLILLGVLHVIVAFAGDILIIYGVLGMLLFLFRRSSQQKLVRIGVFLVIVQVVIFALVATGMMMMEKYAPDEFIAVMEVTNAKIQVDVSVFGDGGFAEIASRRWSEWIGYVLFILPLQGLGIFGFFLFGLAAVKSDVLSNPEATIWLRARQWCLPLGLLLSLIGAYFSSVSDSQMSGMGMWGLTLIFLGAPFSSLGYIGLMAQWSESEMTPLKAFLSRAGSSSLTTYLMQSLILSWVFCGYGLGLYSQIGAFGCILIAAVTGLVTMSFSSLWRTRFKHGPMEHLLRKWTYLGS